MPPATGTASHRTAAVPAVAGSLEDLARTISAGGEETKRLAVVGSSPSAGAAQAALALGRALARDRRVILVDLATGESVIASASTTPGVPGIADLVRGEASFRQIITRDRVSRLHLIAAGGDADRDIAAAARLRTAVNALARTYDHVVLAGGALPRAPVERLALLAPRAILVIGNEGDEAADVGYERLRRAGFGEVTVVQVTGADAATAAA
jgi:Mrp family chromosome partitioning ATPase